MSLIPVTEFGAQFTQSEVIFLANLADHVYTDGQLIIGNSSTGGVSFNTLTAGANITITNGNGTIEIAATGSTGVNSVTGTSNRITVNNTDPANPVVDIAATYVGQTSITTLGTIATGTWNATAIADGKIASALTGKTYNGLTVTTTTGTLTITNGKTLSASNTLTFTGTDGSSVAFGAGGTVLYSTSAANLTVGSSTITSGTNTRILYNNSGVLGEYTLSGSGTVVAMATSPVFTTPTLGVASATSINKVTITAPATGSTLTIADGKTLTASVTMTLQGGDASVLSIAASKTFTVSNTLTFTGTDSSSVAFGAGGTVAYTANNLGVFAASTSAAIGVGTIELGAASDTTLSRAAAGDLAVEGVSVLTTSNSKTVTNKRNQPRTSTSASGDITPDLATANVYQRTAQAAAITINAPTGTPVLGETLAFMLAGNGSDQTLTMNAAFIPYGAAFATKISAGKKLYITAHYNGTNWITLMANEV